MTLPSHICPHCKRAFLEEAFINAQGEVRRWCVSCREEHRQAIIGRRAAKVDSAEATLAQVAKRERYGVGRLANLLALAHVAGEKRALAIRDGRSWRGARAWRAYYKAKRALDNELSQEDKET